MAGRANLPGIAHIQPHGGLFVIRTTGLTIGVEHQVGGERVRRLVRIWPSALLASLQTVVVAFTSAGSLVACTEQPASPTNNRKPATANDGRFTAHPPPIDCPAALAT
jgi:hypothetical protein